MSNWDSLWEEIMLESLTSESDLSPRRVIGYLKELKAEGDRLQDKTRELDAHLSVEQVLAKRWEKYVELMGDDSYTELTPEEYVAQLDNVEEKIRVIKELAEEALSKYTSIQSAYNTRTSALELIMGVINDSSVTSNDTRMEILKQLSYRVSNIRWALEHNDPKFGLNHLSHLEKILEENKIE